MKTAWRVLLGLLLGAAGIAVALYLGLLLNGRPDWRVAVKLIAILAATQWVSFFAARHHIALQVLCGSAVCMGAAVWLLYSPMPLFWEQEDEPHVYSITWRSGVAFVILMAASQGISWLAFRWYRIRGQNRRMSSGPA